ncbi:MAG TPA: hypothetical protein VGH80_08455 [Xanthomonadaceae bacterium]|jgi:hypothetical protein
MTTTTTFQDRTTDAIRWWEVMRVPYNLALAAVVLLMIFLAGPHAANQLSGEDAFALVALAVLANVVYCAAYPADLFVQSSAFRDRRKQFRWMLFAIGTTFACVLARYGATLLIVGG